MGANWLANVYNLQKDACNAMKQDAELGKHWVEQAHLAHECNHLPNNSLESYFEYANACHEGQHLFIPIEPLVSSPELEHTCDVAGYGWLTTQSPCTRVLACQQFCLVFKTWCSWQSRLPAVTSMPHKQNGVTREAEVNAAEPLADE